ncbi:MAG: WD40 repeat domain-containing protein [Bacteroidota bacterium]
MSTYRYPGTQSFRTEDAAIFYGREQDSEHLLRLLLLEQVVVLYGKSGLGKSSLINAGVLPELREQAAVEEVRFGSFSADATHQPLSVLEEQVWSGPIHPIIEELAGEKTNLWARAKSRDLASGQDRHLFLVFDQFEELFTYPRATVQSFKSALSALLQEGSPLLFQQNLRDKIRTEPEAIPVDLRQQLLAPLHVKVLIIVRSDHLSLLHQLTSHFPNVLVNLHELKPLSKSQARTAIIQPAQQSGEQFITPPFSFNPAAVQVMLDSLANTEGEIESFQLQLLCQYLEEKVRRDPNIVLIESLHFGGEEGVQDILHGYYERQLSTLAPSKQARARRFIEEGLLVDGRRAALTAGAEQQRFGVGPELLQQLLDSRLIRAENIHLGKIYELSHDTLIEPVTKSLEQRQALEEKQRIEAELREAEAKAQEEEQRRRRARRFAVAGFLLFAIAAIAGVFAWQKYREADRNERRADAAALAAQAWTIYPHDHTLAFRIAEAALLIDSTSEEVEETLLRIANNPATSFYQKVLTKHQYEVEVVAFNADGSRFATAGQGTNIILWNREGEMLGEYLGHLSGEDQPGHKSRVTTLAFVDDEVLLSSGEDGRIISWSVSTGEKIREWVADAAGVSALVVMEQAQQQLLVTAGLSGLARIWTIDGTEQGSLRGHTSAITDIAYSRELNRLATSSADGTARLWNPNGQLLQLLKNGNTPVNAICFVPGTQSVFVGLRNSLCERINFNGEVQATFNGHGGQITCVTAFPEASYLLTASDDGSAKVWQQNGEIVLTLQGHQKRLNFAGCSPDETLIVTGGFDFTVKLWDIGLNLDIQQHRHGNFIYCVDISEDDETIVTASVDGTAKVWDKSGKWLADLAGHNGAVQSAFFVPGREEIITASRDQSVRVWSTEGEQLLQLDHPAAINIALATADRQRIITGATDGRIRVWSSSGELIKDWSASDEGMTIRWIDLHPDGERMVSAQGNTVSVWNFEGEQLNTFPHSVGDVETIHKVAFAADGESVYTCARELPVRRWTLDGQKNGALYGHTQENYWVSPHSQQAIILTAGWDQNVHIWDTAGTILTKIPHPNGVYSVALADSEEWLVTGSHDNIGRLWTITGEPITRLGERTDVLALTDQRLIAPLSNIPYSISESQLSEKYLDVLANGQPEQYQREGLRAVELALQNRFSTAQKLSYFAQAVEWLKLAKTYTPAEQHELLNQQIAETFQYKTDLLIIERRFSEAVEAAEEGLVYAERDYLKVLKTMALGYSGAIEEALRFSEQYQGTPTPQIDWYETYDEAVVYDLYWFQDQYGIAIGQADTLIARLEVPE